MCLNKNYAEEIFFSFKAHGYGDLIQTNEKLSPYGHVTKAEQAESNNVNNDKTTAYLVNQPFMFTYFGFITVGRYRPAGRKFSSV